LVKKNIIANLIGNIWLTFLSFAFVPLYIHFMGIEAYGLVGFYVTLQAVLLLLDMGLSATLSRELARLSADSGDEQRMRDLVRTLEFVYLSIALMVVCAAVLSASWISHQWLNASQLSPETVQQAIVLMGVVVAGRMVSGFYYGALQGLQKQVLLNKVKILIGTVQSGGVVLMLWLVSPTVSVFFAWQAVIGGLGAGLLMATTWKSLPVGMKARYRSDLFRTIWKFAAGMSVISLLSVILMQMDKIVLSKIVSLEIFAYYTLASSVAMGLYTIISPIFQALYPRLSQLVAGNNEDEITALYHKSCQLMAVAIMPLAIVLAGFALDILHLWIRNDEVAVHTAPILSLLILGTALNGVMNVPYALQLAHGWTKLAIVFDVASIALFIPMLLLLLSIYGVVGAAAVWIILNVFYIVFLLRVMHSKLLPGEMRRWFVFDFVTPSVAPLGVVIVSRYLMPIGLDELSCLAWIVVTLICALISSLLCAFSLRSDAVGLYHAYLLNRKPIAL